MDSKKKTARIAGLWYLLMGITGAFGIMYAPFNILAAGDAAETARNLVDSGWIYRLSIISNLAGQVFFIFLVLALNRLLKEVNPKQAELMVTLVTVAVPVAFLNTLNLGAAQLLVSGADYLQAFQTTELNALAMGFLHLYEQGVTIVQIFWGLWLLPFGLLVMKSKFIPKILGILLVINCFAYLIESFTGLLLPQYREMISSLLMPFLAVGELAIILWLLIKGVKENTDHAAAEINAVAETG